MSKHIRKYFLIAALAGATAFSGTALAQQYPTAEQNPQDRQDQVRHDQNAPVNQDQDQVRRDQDHNPQYSDQDQNRQYQDRDRSQLPQSDQGQVRQGDRDHDRDQARPADQDRDRYSTGSYGANQQWVNSKAYQQGLKDGEHDRAKNKSQRAHEKHWKSDQDHQAYQAGYDSGFRGMQGGDHDRDRDGHQR